MSSWLLVLEGAGGQVREHQEVMMMVIVGFANRLWIRGNRAATAKSYDWGKRDLFPLKRGESHLFFGGLLGGLRGNFSA